jgi:hypothetical protein
MHKYNFGQVHGVHLLSWIPTNYNLHFLNFLQIYIKFGSLDGFCEYLKHYEIQKKYLR